MRILKLKNLNMRKIFKFFKYFLKYLYPHFIIKIYFQKKLLHEKKSRLFGTRFHRLKLS